MKRVKVHSGERETDGSGRNGEKKEGGEREREEKTKKKKKKMLL